MSHFCNKAQQNMNDQNDRVNPYDEQPQLVRSHLNSFVVGKEC